MSDSWNLIFSYTRKQAIEDGVLVDVTEQAKEVGFKLHTVVTDHLYYGYLVPPEGLPGEGQSFEGRLHDVLMLAMAAARSRMTSDRVEFEVSFLMKPGKLEVVQVIAHVGPGDEGEPVLTFMLPGDD